jgi:hypothetical protein
MNNYVMDLMTKVKIKMQFMTKKTHDILYKVLKTQSYVIP